MESFEKTTGKFEASDGTPIYYEVRGQGDVVIFIYGIACLMNHWHHQIRHFSSSMQTLMFDLRGHHQSQPVTDVGRLTMEALASDALELLEKLGAERAHFVGHSFGAPVILEAYRQKPSAFKSVTFINGFAKNPIKGMFGLDVVEPFFHFVKTAYAKNPVVWDSLWRMAIDNPVSMRLAALAGGFNLHLTHFKDIEVYARGVAHMELPIFLALFEEMMNFNGDDILSSIQVPALIIAGENDRVTPKHFQEDLRKGIPNAQYLSVPYGSHCTQLDFPDYVNLRMAEFFASIK